MRRWLVVLAVVLVGVPLLCVAWFFLEARARVAAKRATAAPESVRAIMAADKVLGELFNGPLFSPPDGDDAGEFLNPKLDFSDGAEKPPPLLSETCKARLQALRGHEEAVTAADLEACDTTLLTELRKYGQWSYLHGRRVRIEDEGRTWLNMPLTIELTSLARAHLMRGHLNGQLSAAIDDVVHLARLLFSGEYLVSVNLGLAQLRSARELVMKLDPSLWTGPSEAQLDAIQQRCFFTYYAMTQLMPASFGESLFRQAPRAVRCTIVTEQVFGRVWTSVPSEPGCSFVHARFELEHPMVQEGERPWLDALTPPAKLGGSLVNTIAPGALDTLKHELEWSDALPSGDTWSSIQSESTERFMRAYWSQRAQAR